MQHALLGKLLRSRRHRMLSSMPTSLQFHYQKSTNFSTFFFFFFEILQWWSGWSQWIPVDGTLKLLQSILLWWSISQWSLYCDSCALRERVIILHTLTWPFLFLNYTCVRKMQRTMVVYKTEMSEPRKCQIWRSLTCGTQASSACRVIFLFSRINLCLFFFFRIFGDVPSGSGMNAEQNN